MSKKYLEDSELQKLTISPTNIIEDSHWIHPSTNPRPNKDDQNFSSVNTQVKSLSKSVPAASDKKKVEKSQSGPPVGNRNPSMKISSLNNQGYSKVNYSSEKKHDTKKADRPPFVPPPQKKESSSSLFSRSPSISFKRSPLISLRHKEEHAKSPGHFWFKDHFMGKHSPLQKQVKKNGSGGSSNPLKLRGEVKEPHRRLGYCSPLRKVERPTQHHAFSSDASDVQQIEKKLLQLMEDFETGKLKAFGKDSRLRQMEEIREQQERLARLHFDVGAEQDLYPPLSEDGLKISEKNMKTLMEKLAQLSESIENLHTKTHADRRPCPADGTHSNGSHSLFAETSQSSAQSFNADTLHCASTSHSSSAHHVPSQYAPSHNASVSHHATSQYTSSHHVPPYSAPTSQPAPTQNVISHQTSSHNATASHHQPHHTPVISHQASSHSATAAHHQPHHHHHYKSSKAKQHQQGACLEAGENVATCSTGSKVNVLNPGNNSLENPNNGFQMKILSTHESSNYPPPKLKLKHTN